MSYTPTTWVTGDTITATKLNKLENGVANAGGGGYDAVIKLVHDNSSSVDNESYLTPSIVSGTFAEIADKLENDEIPVILVLYENPFFNLKASTVATAITYYAPNASVPYFSFLAGGYFIKTAGARTLTLLDLALNWYANGDLDFE